MDPAKIETIIKCEAFKSMKRVQKFLGFVSFYREFNQISQLIMLLTIFFEKNTKFDWSETTNEVFSKPNQIFVTVPLLIRFDNTRETVLETNVSIWCIGDILFQYIDGIFRPALTILKRIRGPNEITKFTIKIWK